VADGFEHFPLGEVVFDPAHIPLEALQSFLTTIPVRAKGSASAIMRRNSGPAAEESRTEKVDPNRTVHRDQIRFSAQRLPISFCCANNWAKRDYASTMTSAAVWP
jgi:hypothetical protein